MSVTDAGRTPSIYVPPKQGLRGQLLDSVIILALLFVVLFGVTYYNESSSSGSSTANKSLAQLPITAAERAQYQKLIDEGVVDLAGINSQVAASHARGDKYPIRVGAAILTFGVIAAYLFFVYFISFREYREVIRERFGGDDTPATTQEVGP
jgi:hypothetical protein